MIRGDGGADGGLPRSSSMITHEVVCCSVPMRPAAGNAAAAGGTAFGCRDRTGRTTWCQGCGGSPVPPSPSWICAWWCGVTCTPSLVSCAGRALCVGELNPDACPRRARREPNLPAALGFAHASASVTCSASHLSLQQVDLPVHPLDDGVDLAKLPGEVVGLPSQLGDREC